GVGRWGGGGGGGAPRGPRPAKWARARRGRGQARRAVQQRGLARARGPHHGGEAASLEAQRDVVERGGGGTLAAVPLGHPGQADHVLVSAAQVRSLATPAWRRVVRFVGG